MTRRSPSGAPQNRAATNGIRSKESRCCELDREYLDHPIGLANVKDRYAWDILWQHGGLYLDLDTISLRPCWDLLTRDVCVSLEHEADFTEGHPYNSAVTLGRKGSEVLLDLANRSEEILDSGYSRWGSCGPHLLTDVVADYPGQVRHRTVRSPQRLPRRHSHPLLQRSAARTRRARRAPVLVQPVPSVRSRSVDAVTPIRTACVTGGAGFIGSHVVDVLLERGCKRVLVLDDLSTGRLENVNEDAAFVQADVSTVRAIAEIEREQSDVIFHLAAQTDVQTSFREPANDALANVFGVLRIAEAAKRCGAKVVFASTGGAMYGDAAPASEDTPPDPRSPYAVSKLAGEGYLRCLLPGSVILRYANVYGPRQSAALEGGVAAIFTEARRQSKYATVFGDGHPDPRLRARQRRGRGDRRGSKPGWRHVQRGDWRRDFDQRAGGHDRCRPQVCERSPSR